MRTFHITVLESADTSRPLNKRIDIQPDGTWKKQGFRDAYLYRRWLSPQLSTIEDVAEFLPRVIKSAQCCIVTGSPIVSRDMPLKKPVPRLKHDYPGEPEKKKPPHKATLGEQVTPLLPIDIDDIDIPDSDVINDPVSAAQSVIDRLGAEFDSVSCFWQLSASQKPDTGKLRIRLFFVCDQAHGNADYKRWAKALQKNGIPIDTAIYQAAQIIYTAAPAFFYDDKPVTDPIPQRYGLIVGERDTVTLTIPEEDERQDAGEYERQEWNGNPVELAKIKAALSVIPMDKTPYEDKIKIGMALYALGDTGLELWQEWLAEWQHYDSIRRRWLTFKNTEHPPKLATIFYFAEQYGYKQGSARRVIDAEVIPIDAAAKRSELLERIKTATDTELENQITPEIITFGFSHVVQDSLLKAVAKQAGGSIGELRKDVKQMLRQSRPQTWRDSLSTNDEGEPHPSLGNMALILRNDKAWTDVLSFDEFSLIILKKKKPPYGGKPGEWQDLDDYRTAMWLEEKYRMRAKSAVVNEAIQVIAHDNVFHPVQDYLNSLKWDGRPRVTKWLTNYIGADDKPYHRLVGKLWLVGAVARIFEPGCKMDNVLILEGAQGVGKSSALEILFSKKWYADSDIDFGSKDAILQMQGKWLIELAELSSFSRAESERVKGFFSRSQDTFRPPYGRAPMTVQRSCVFSGSANPAQYLKDETGNRRYWPVKSGEVKKDLLKRDRDQVWAEAVQLYRSGEEWWVNGNMDIITEEQEQRYTGDAWEEMIIEWLKGQEANPHFDGVTTGAIFTNCLDVEKGRWNKSDQMRIAGILKRLGYHRKKVHNSLTNCKEWKFVKQVLKVPT